MKRFHVAHHQQDALQGLRDDLYRFACAYVGEVHDTYSTCPPVANIRDRTEELWLPILTLAKVIDATANALKLFDQMVQFAGELCQEQQEHFMTRDTRIIAGLYFFLQDRGLLDQPTPEVNAAEMTTFIKAAEDIQDLRIEEVSRILGRAKLIDKKFRRRIAGHGSSTNPLMHYALKADGVKERVKTLGLLAAS